MDGEQKKPMHLELNNENPDEIENKVVQAIRGADKENVIEVVFTIGRNEKVEKALSKIERLYQGVYLDISLLSSIAMNTPRAKGCDANLAPVPARICTPLIEFFKVTFSKFDVGIQTSDASSLIKV
ncbi:hypothetical protein WR25_14847 [Diploscapter pachys]|uniref:Uncharacterized protein n=1 Tax=Diploscapter pachys TaxID=2018661 RepID=A0A2A2KMY6_9BILA|nr:hypothetical protein WR25_14847 [Diploscapter pachys]